MRPMIAEVQVLVAEWTASEMPPVTRFSFCS
jgi:hypothetical protein